MILSTHESTPGPCASILGEIGERFQQADGGIDLRLVMRLLTFAASAVELRIAEAADPVAARILCRGARSAACCLESALASARLAMEDTAKLTATAEAVAHE